MIFERLYEKADSPEFRGCAFALAVAEHGDPERVVTVARTHKRMVRDIFETVMSKAGCDWIRPPPTFRFFTKAHLPPSRSGAIRMPYSSPGLCALGIRSRHRRDILRRQDMTKTIDYFFGIGSPGLSRHGAFRHAR